MTSFERHLTAANGYIELGMWFDANEALEDIEPELRATAEVLQRCEKIYAAFQTGAASLLAWSPPATAWVPSSRPFQSPP